MSVSAVPNSLPLWQQRTGVTPEQIARFCDRWGVSEFFIFGSVVRDDFRSDSDVDVMVRLDPERPRDGWYWVEMVDELREMFGRKVDMILGEPLENPFFRRAVLSERQIIYAA
jgi:predicted nucleotidyltransferase